MAMTATSAERTNALRAIEAQLEPGQPVLTQSLLRWNIGITADEPSVAMADRCEGIRVKGYVNLHFSPFMYLVKGGLALEESKLDARSIMPNPTHESGRTIMYMPDIYGMPFRGEHQMPSGIYGAYTRLLERRRAGEAAPGQLAFVNRHGHGSVTHIGVEAVEANLGVSLPEVLTLVDNGALRSYVASKT